MTAIAEKNEPGEHEYKVQHHKKIIWYFCLLFSYKSQEEIAMRDHAIGGTFTFDRQWKLGKRSVIVVLLHLKSAHNINCLNYAF